MTDRSREPFGAAMSVLERWIAVEGARASMDAGAERRAYRGRGAAKSEISPEARQEEFAAEVRNSIYWDLAVPRDRVCVQCDRGWVTLTGAVDRAYQRSAAEADVRRVPGVLGITNAITVGPTS